MALGAGTRLGPYEILSPLGAGGMGEVYRARDSKLDRDVAIKVLPEVFAQDKDRLARFEHPNILAIHDFGNEGGIVYAVAELLEGETLRDQLGRGRLPARKAIEYGIQVARGLAAAHDKGITHRDLKPENLFVTEDGRIKILDFGLAKTEHPHGESEASNSSVPTRAAGTQAGAVLGTVGYMSPEQVRGEPADARSDLFSLGAIIYEMLAGRRAFHRDTAPETMTAVLNEDPLAVTADDPIRPPTLERIVQRCLEKRSGERFQSARDLAFALESLTLESGRTEVLPRPIRPRARALIAAVLAFVGLVTAFYLWRSTGRPSSGAPAVSYERLTFRRGQVNSARFDPAGQNVVYSASWEGQTPELFSTRPGSRASRPLELVGADIHAVSREGDITILKKEPGLRLYLRPGTVAISSLVGEASREVMEDVLLADRTVDGDALAVVRVEGGRQRVEYPIGRRLYETTNQLGGFRLSRDGDTLAVGEKPQGISSAWHITFLGRDGTSARYSTGVRGDQLDFAWSPDGREVWFNTVLGGSLDLYAMSRKGQLRVLVSPPVLLRIMDVSREGLALVARTTYRFDVMGVGPADTRERNYSWLDATEVDAITPDGSTMLLTEFGEGGGAETWSVYLRKSDGSPAVRLGDGQAHDLSPDGAWALTQRLTAPPSLVLLPTGPGAPVELENTQFVDFLGASFTPDGEHVVFVGVEEGQLPRFYLQPVSGGDAEPVTPGIGSRHLIPGALLGQSPMAPDGRTLATFSHDDRLALYPIDGGSPKAIDGVEPGWWVEQWSPDGRFLYVRELEETHANIYRVEPATGRRELWKTLTPADPTGFEEVYAVHIADDEQSYYYTISRVLSDLYLVRGLR
jgi:serine/threonine protein kinase/Tol biopolymer transport system component